MKSPHNPIRWAALICVAVTSAYVMVMGYRINEILSGPDWCSKALQAERISSQTFGGLTACTDLLKIQLKSLATNSHILFGVVALCLLALIVIVVAGGRLSGKFAGAEVDVGQAGDAARAADEVAGAAVDQANEIKESLPGVMPSPESLPERSQA